MTYVYINQELIAEVSVVEFNKQVVRVLKGNMCVLLFVHPSNRWLNKIEIKSKVLMIRS